ncbi:FHA domain protein, putative [Plasmodium berghei]|uniref:FHA domain protein, putative n=2 Tax=Plasmodium berghei TaxID=5821 RepID=A0A509AIU7_PLABA|nr:FHA domain protein, putative [Plasmodium berghei ANKA]CXI31090.1 FHA domain protein, putative [Plasmodium berghei]SCM20948.1 FHA domain protein, putative [Plasmodium berghei]SCN24387.1 FHA domain protein, putative [Plasmodium berghei]SCO59572.1 FHA domain protein, putative [Plasmodium berghei]SCO60778.1 FHA domain protein, putative [Plasmodium berghei]|eukprot:XP_034421080.1 FHA domain protein, putative [Plasmodium berghei ANKA]
MINGRKNKNIKTKNYVINVNCYTWINNNHGLFDYESDNFYKKCFKIKCLYNYYYILKDDINLEIKNEEEINKISLNNTNLKVICKIKYTNNNYQLIPCIENLYDERNDNKNDAEENESNEQNEANKFWIIVKYLKNKTSILHENDIIKLGRVKLKVKKIITNIQQEKEYNKSLSPFDEDECETAAPDLEHFSRINNDGILEGGMADVNIMSNHFVSGTINQNMQFGDNNTPDKDICIKYGTLNDNFDSSSYALYNDINDSEKNELDNNNNSNIIIRSENYSMCCYENNKGNENDKREDNIYISGHNYMLKNNTPNELTIDTRIKINNTMGSPINNTQNEVNIITEKNNIPSKLIDSDYSYDNFYSNIKNNDNNKIPKVEHGRNISNNFDNNNTFLKKYDEKNYSIHLKDQKNGDNNCDGNNNICEKKDDTLCPHRNNENNKEKENSKAVKFSNVDQNENFENNKNKLNEDKKNANVDVVNRINIPDETTKSNFVNYTSNMLEKEIDDSIYDNDDDYSIYDYNMNSKNSINGNMRNGQTGNDVNLCKGNLQGNTNNNSNNIYDNTIDKMKEGMKNSSYNTLNINTMNCGIPSLYNCRICLCEYENEGNPLISPCKCKGSMKYIHLNCLRTWMKGRLNVRSDGDSTVSFFWKQLSCELCKFPYPTYIYVQNKYLELYEIPKPELPYMIIELLNDKSKGFYIVSLANAKSARMGRGHDSDVRINDISVSRFHALIKFLNGNFYIEDCKSKFGTLIQIRRPVFFNIRRSKFIALQIGRTVMYIYMKRKNWMFFPICLKLPRTKDDDVSALDNFSSKLLVDNSLNISNNNFEYNLVYNPSENDPSEGDQNPNGNCGENREQNDANQTHPHNSPNNSINVGINLNSTGSIHNTTVNDMPTNQSNEINGQNNCKNDESNNSASKNAMNRNNSKNCY